MKFIPQSLKTLCVITLVRNYTYINFTILPRELSAEIASAFRDPNYGEQQVMIYYVIGFSSPHREILEYLLRHDPKNPILHYYEKGHCQYYYHKSIQNGNVVCDMIYDSVQDIVIVTGYTYYVNNLATCFYCYLEDDLPKPLLEKLRSKYNLVSSTVSISLLRSTNGRW